MTRTDCCVVLAFALACAGALFALEHATERAERISRLRKSRANITSQLGAAQRMLDNAERELALEADNPQAGTIRDIYGFYVKDFSGRLASVDARLAELGAAE